MHGWDSWDHALITELSVGVPARRPAWPPPPGCGAGSWRLGRGCVAVSCATGETRAVHQRPQVGGAKPWASGTFSWLKEFVYSGGRCKGLLVITQGCRKVAAAWWGCLGR